MQITIELLNEHALNLLRDLEKMSIIRVVQTDMFPPMLPLTNKSRFAGRISKTTAEHLHIQLNQMRAAWQESNI